MAIKTRPVYPKPMPTSHLQLNCVCSTVFLLSALACSVEEHPSKQATTQNDSTDSGYEQPTGTDLVFFDQWTILSQDHDPFPHHRTEEHQCDPSGVLAEEGVLEINTNDCGYAVVGQPLQMPIQSGDAIELLMYHSALSAVDVPAEAHFSLMIGENVFWESTIPIPWQAEVYIVPMVIDWDAEAETMVKVHLHNHGGNSWRVGYLKRIN